ncbi:MAG TPA: formyltetrahydrofolate deformylase [Candidatus Eisenbacteria bacterium]|nr:formyltetrahydrofolate deformylase [Candidatus Eisenbacteria bacterium]
MAESTHVLRIECPDEKGLVYKVTEVLFKKGLNIVNNAEFVDHANRRFFMRTEFSGSVDSKSVLKSLRSRLPEGAAVEIARERKKDVVVLGSSEPHCVGDLLLRHANGELPARVLAVVSNHASLKKLVGRFRVPFHHVPAKEDDRAAHEAAVLRILSRYRPEYLVLAKYMRILSARFLARYRNRVINIHHSFLPAFVGANPYRQASERGVKIIGATAHYVNEELDMGPIIAQGVIPVDHSHSAVDMAQAGRDVEKIVLARALKLAFEDRIFVSGNKTVIFD